MAMPVPCLCLTHQGKGVILDQSEEPKNRVPATIQQAELT
jgi:hypothetical protein